VFGQRVIFYYLIVIVEDEARRIVLGTVDDAGPQRAEYLIVAHGDAVGAQRIGHINEYRVADDPNLEALDVGDAFDWMLGVIETALPRRTSRRRIVSSNVRAVGSPSGRLNWHVPHHEHDHRRGERCSYEESGPKFIRLSSGKAPTAILTRFGLTPGKLVCSTNPTAPNPFSVTATKLSGYCLVPDLRQR
jgi:hypothetical protein